MIWLLVVSLIWAFSFGLIKTQLSGLDSSFVSFIRMLISYIVFLPFLRLKNIEKPLIFKLIITGMIQYGLMYLTYIYAYRFLAAYEAALFTIFTPLYITLFNDLFSGKFHRLFLFEAFISVIAVAIVVYNRLSTNGLIAGFILMQISNLSFAFGQIYYKKLLRNKTINDSHIFALLYGGAVLLTGLTLLIQGSLNSIQIGAQQVYTLLYLGAIASGLSFFLWNYGVRRTNTGALSIFNNLKIPLAIAVSIIFFNEQADITRLLIAFAILLGLLFYNQSYIKKDD